MMISDVPRDLIYKYVEDINYFIGSNNEKSLEREFYDRLIRLPFIANSPYATNLVCTIFNNARYIYYLIDVEENSVSLCFYCYLTKAAEGIEDEETQKVITASTMALVYNWISYQLDHNREHVPELKKEIHNYFCEDKEADVLELKQMILHHFNGESDNTTSDSIDTFSALLIDGSELPIRLENHFDVPNLWNDGQLDHYDINDIAKGIDYIIEGLHVFFDSAKERRGFLEELKDVLNNQKLVSDKTDVIELAKRKIEQAIVCLRSEPKGHHTLGLDLSNISRVSEESIPESTESINKDTPVIEDVLERNTFQNIIINTNNFSINGDVTANHINNIHDNDVVNLKVGDGDNTPTRFPHCRTNDQGNNTLSFLIEKQFIPKETDTMSYLYLMGCTDERPSNISHIKWLKTKQLLREMLELWLKPLFDEKSFKKADMERKCPQIFVYKKNNKMKLAKNKPNPSTDSDKLFKFFATL